MVPKDVVACNVHPGMLGIVVYVTWQDFARYPQEFETWWHRHFALFLPCPCDYIVRGAAHATLQLRGRSTRCVVGKFQCVDSDRGHTFHEFIFPRIHDQEWERRVEFWKVSMRGRIEDNDLLSIHQICVGFIHDDAARFVVLHTCIFR